MIRSLLKFLLILAFLLPLLSCKKTIDNLGIKLTLEKRSLGNGLQVIMVEDHTVPVITYQTWFRVGSVDEKPGITGISHLFEHLMFKGTPKYGPKQFFQQLEAKGAEVNAFTTRDYTVYYESFTSDLLEKVVDMESDRLANLKLDDEVLRTERQVVLEERRLRTDNSPAGKIQEALWGLAFHRHPYQWPVIGYPQDVLRITVADLMDYFRTHYQPANATIVIVGDFVPDEAFKLIRKHYDPIPGRPRPTRNIRNEPEQEEERRLILRDHVASERFAWAFHVTPAENDDSYALDVLANILFEGTSSRAYRRLVEEKDLLLGISGSAYTPTFPGLFIMSGTLKGQTQAASAEAALQEVIKEVQEKPVTEEEIRIAVRQLTVQLVDSVRTPYGLGQLIGTVAMVFGDPERFSQDLAKYTRVTADDVKRVAQKYLIPNNRSVVTLVPLARGVVQR
jgi:zinc protease